jgi:hypothetical protein
MDVVEAFLNDEYVAGIDSLVFFCIANEINKAELKHFASMLLIPSGDYN